METLTFIIDNLPFIGAKFVEHISLVGVAVGLAILTGVPIGIAITQNERIANGVPDDETMARLNARVDVERETIEAVAGSFLQEQGLI